TVLDEQVHPPTTTGSSPSAAVGTNEAANHVEQALDIDQLAVLAKAENPHVRASAANILRHRYLSVPAPFPHLVRYDPHRPTGRQAQADPQTFAAIEVELCALHDMMTQFETLEPLQPLPLVRPLTLLVGRGTPAHCTTKALKVLSQYLRDDSRLKEKAVEFGLIRRLVDLLKHRSDLRAPAPHLALNLLHQLVLTEHEAILLECDRQHVLEEVLETLKATLGLPTLTKTCLSILMLFTIYRDSDHPDRLTMDQRFDLMHDHKFFQVVMPCLRQDDIEVVVPVVGVLFGFVHREKYLQQLRSLPGLTKALCFHLSPEHVSLCRLTLGVLRGLLMNCDRLSRQIIRDRSVKKIGQCLKSPDEDVQWWVMVVLWMLSSYWRSHKFILSSGLFVKYDHYYARERFRKFIAGIFANVCAVPMHYSWIVEKAQFVPRLRALLFSEDFTLQSQFFQALESFLVHSVDLADRLLDEASITRLIKLLHETESESRKAQVALILHLLCRWQLLSETRLLRAVLQPLCTQFYNLVGPVISVFLAPDTGGQTFVLISGRFYETSLAYRPEFSYQDPALIGSPAATAADGEDDDASPEDALTSLSDKVIRKLVSQLRACIKALYVFTSYTHLFEDSRLLDLADSESKITDTLHTWDSSEQSYLGLFYLCLALRIVLQLPLATDQVLARITTHELHAIRQVVDLTWDEIAEARQSWPQFVAAGKLRSMVYYNTLTAALSRIGRELLGKNAVVKRHTLLSGCPWVEDFLKLAFSHCEVTKQNYLLRDLSHDAFQLLLALARTDAGRPFIQDEWIARTTLLLEWSISFPDFNRKANFPCIAPTAYFGSCRPYVYYIMEKIYASALSRPHRLPDMICHFFPLFQLLERLTLGIGCEPDPALMSPNLFASPYRVRPYTQITRHQRRFAMAVEIGTRELDDYGDDTSLTSTSSSSSNGSQGDASDDQGFLSNPSGPEDVHAEETLPGAITLLAGPAPPANHVRSVPTLSESPTVLEPLAYERLVNESPASQFCTVEMLGDYQWFWNPHRLFPTVRATHGVTGTGRFAFEIQICVSNHPLQVGWMTDGSMPVPELGCGVGQDFMSYAFNGHQRAKCHGFEGQLVREKYGEYWKVDDVVTCLLDLDTQTMAFAINGVSMGVAFGGRTPTASYEEGVVPLDPQRLWYPAVSLATNQSVRLLLGDAFGPLRYCPPDYVPFAQAAFAHSDSHSHHRAPESQLPTISAIPSTPTTLPFRPDLLMLYTESCWDLYPQTGSYVVGGFESDRHLQLFVLAGQRWVVSLQMPSALWHRCAFSLCLQTWLLEVKELQNSQADWDPCDLPSPFAYYSSTVESYIRQARYRAHTLPQPFKVGHPTDTLGVGLMTDGRLLLTINGSVAVCTNGLYHPSQRGLAATAITASGPATSTASDSPSWVNAYYCQHRRAVTKSVTYNTNWLPWWRFGALPSNAPLVAQPSATASGESAAEASEAHVPLPSPTPRSGITAIVPSSRHKLNWGHEPFKYAAANQPLIRALMTSYLKRRAQPYYEALLIAR
ncbi:hypothetical protein H4R35_002485, partial [Dimargaris xerosporica]